MRLEFGSDVWRAKFVAFAQSIGCTTEVLGETVELGITTGVPPTELERVELRFLVRAWSAEHDADVTILA